MADALVGGIFFKHKLAFHGFELLLLDGQHAVQIGHGLFLLLQLHFLHEVDALPAGVEGLGVEQLDAVYLHLGFVVVAGFEGGTGFVQLQGRFLFHVFAGSQCAAEACQNDCFLHISSLIA